MDEIIKIQTIFGNDSWVILSEKETRLKENLKKGLEYFKEFQEGIHIYVENEAYYTEKLEICKKLSEALNPKNWETLGAEEIGKRIRNFQEIQECKF